MIEVDPGITRILTAGDWAAASRNAEALAQAARDIFPMIESGPLQLELSDIARLASRDIAAAAARWAVVSAHLLAHILLATSQVGHLAAKA